jgi:DNA (cytosine-5)-methyltransferase 1
MKFIDLFSGIGGFRLGMERNGHECVGHCEIDPYADKSYRAMHDTEGEWYRNDIRTVRSEEIPYADVWCAGFPCQDISVAGKQQGLDGNRSQLYFQLIGLVKGKEESDRPKYILLENVKNLLSVSQGWDFLRVLIALDEVGYDAEWQVLNTKDFGLPQNRERVFVVGHSRNRRTGEVFPITGTDGTADDVQGQYTNSLTTRYFEGQARGSYVIEGECYTNALTTSNSHTVKSYIIEGEQYAQEVRQIGNVNPSGRGMNGNVFDSNGLSPALTTKKGE